MIRTRELKEGDEILVLLLLSSSKFTEENKPKAGFATPFGLFECNVMPFGLQGAPST